MRWYKKHIGFKLFEEDIALLKIPTNVYGITKMMDERMLLHAERETGGRYVVLRYFNAAGADPSRLIGEDHDPETHLIPIVLQVALGQREKMTVFGDDYATPDGTAVRDYISVVELADAHIKSLDMLLAGGRSATYNLGRGQGVSVREILEAAREVTGHAIPETIGPRRSGDPTTLIADASRIQRDMGWTAKETLHETIESAWHWHRLHPQGYRVVQEERFNPFWNRWINIAAHRADRPWRGETQLMEGADDKAYDPECYLCPGNTRATGDVNPNYKGVLTFENDFPTLVLDAYQTQAQLGPYLSRTSRGVCEVVVYAPNHAQRLSTLSLDAFVQVIDAWAEIYDRLGKASDIVYPLIFENRGTVMGNSQPHPHGQVYAYCEIPDLMVKPQLAMFESHREKTGHCFVCDANRLEAGDGLRVIVDGPHVLAYVPFAAQFPYDVIIVPKAHVASLLDLEREERRDLAVGVARCSRRVGRVVWCAVSLQSGIDASTYRWRGSRLSHANSHYVAFAETWLAKARGGGRYFWQSHQSLRSGYDGGGDPVGDAESREGVISMLHPIITQARDAFASVFEDPADVVVQAPGRVNLIGEHTDYNAGFVFPAAIDRWVVVAARSRVDSRVRIYSAMHEEVAEFRGDDVLEAQGDWADYPKGVVREFQKARAFAVWF